MNKLGIYLQENNIALFEDDHYKELFNESDFYLDFEDYQIAKEQGFLAFLIQDTTLLTEAAKSTDKYRELESTGKKWLKYGLGWIGGGTVSGVYHGIKHKNAKLAAAGIGSDLAAGALYAAAGVGFPFSLVYMWWQRKKTDVCRNKCSGKRDRCYYSCYINATNELIKLQQRDLDQAKKMGMSDKVQNKISKQIKFYMDKRRKFEMKLKDMKK
jgi:hypothetical protein